MRRRIRPALAGRRGIRVAGAVANCALLRTAEEQRQSDQQQRQQIAPLWSHYNSPEGTSLHYGFNRHVIPTLSQTHL